MMLFLLRCKNTSPVKVEQILHQKTDAILPLVYIPSIDWAVIFQQEKHDALAFLKKDFLHLYYSI